MRILLVTATKVESKAVMDAFGHGAKPDSKAGVEFFDLGKLNAARLFLVECEVSPDGGGGRAPNVRNALAALCPNEAIVVGTAFGINKTKQAIGEILVSKQLLRYDLPPDCGELIFYGDTRRGSAWLIEWLQTANQKWNGAKVRFGNVLSGDKLAPNFDLREQLLRYELEAIGGEMEAAGLHASGHDLELEWVVVKGICDWAGGGKAKNQSARLKQAASNAASFVFHALRLVPREGEFLQTRAPTSSLLPAQTFFFGREKELASIAEAISPEAGSWGALIDGPGGIGKTALAARAGHLAPEGQFSRKIFLSGTAREPIVHPSCIGLLTELARELGAIEIARAPENERAKAVTRALADRNVLIVIDELEAFVEPERTRLVEFLGSLPQGCKAIVTGPCGDVDVRVIRLRGMEEKDALALLDELAKTKPLLAAATGEERQALYELTAGNPLLLRWTVELLGRRRKIGAACAHLKKAPKGNSLEWVFGDLLTTCSKKETAVLTALACFTQPAKVEWISELSGLSEREAETALDDLADRAILQRDPVNHTFILLAIAARVVQDRHAEAVSEARERLAEFVYSLVRHNGFSKYKRFPMLEAEWPWIAAALPRLVEGESGRLSMACSALAGFLEFSGRWDEKIALNEQAERRAVNANRLTYAGSHATHIGYTYCLRGQAAEVLACAERAEAYYRQGRSGAGYEASAIGLRGFAYCVNKDYRAAITAFERSLEVFRITSLESVAVGSLLNDLARAKQGAGDYDSAERDYRHALQIAKAHSSFPEDAAEYTSNLGGLAEARGDWSGSEQLAREALALYEELGHPEGIGVNCCRLALSLARLDRHTEAIPPASRAVEIFSKLRMLDALKGAQAVLRDCEGRFIALLSTCEIPPPPLF